MGLPLLVFLLMILAGIATYFSVFFGLKYAKLKKELAINGDQKQADKLSLLNENLSREQKLNEELAQREEELLSNEEELRQSLESQSNLLTEIQIKEASLSALINNSSDLIFSFDKEYCLVDFNSAARKFYTEKGAAFDRGVHFSKFVTPKNLKHAALVLNKVMMGEPHITVFDIIDENDNKTFFESYYNPIRDEQNIVFGISVMIREITERIKAEQILRASEEKYSKAFRSSPDAVIITVVDDSRIIEFNESFLTWSGYTREEVEGKSTVDLAFWDLAEREKLKQELRKNGKIVEFEVHLKIKSGEIHHCLMSAETIELEGELCFVSITRDVTARKKHQELLLELLNTEKELNAQLAQREEELTSNEEELRLSLESQSILLDEIQLKSVSLSALINNTNDFIYSLDKNLCIVEFNTAVQNFYSERGIELRAGLHVNSFISQKNSVHSMEVFTSVLNGNYDTALIEVPGPNESTLFFESSFNPIYNDSKEVIGISVMIREVTERVKFLQALRASEEKYSKWFRSSPDSIIISSMEGGQLMEVNDSFLSNLGLEREAVIGKTSAELGFMEDPTDSARIRELVKQNEL